MKIYSPIQFSYISNISNNKFQLLKMDAEKGISSKKVFPLLSSGNNVELPTYFINKNLPANQLTQAHQPRYQNSKKITKPLRLATENETSTRNKKFVTHRRMFSESKESACDWNYIRDRDKFIEEYNRKYCVRSYDIITNNNVNRYQFEEFAAQKKYFSNILKMKTPITERNKIRKDLVSKYVKIDHRVNNMYGNNINNITWMKY